MRLVTRYFIRGILFLTPITLTIYIFYTLFRKIDEAGVKLLSPWLGEGTLVAGIGFVLTVCLITLIGYLSSLWIGSVLIGWVENQILKNAVINGIYTTIRDLVQSFYGREKFFSKVVLVDFPSQGLKKMGFVTQEISVLCDPEHVVVYIPHSFQISGDMVVVPKKNIQPLQISTKAAVKMIMSGGLVKE